MRKSDYCRMDIPEQEDIYDVDDFGRIFDDIDGQQHRQDQRLSALEAENQRLWDALEALRGRVDRFEDALFSKVTSNPFSVTFETLDTAAVEGVWNRERSRMEC